MYNLDTFQKDFINDLKLDSRNIYFETEENNYYNDDYWIGLDNGQIYNSDITNNFKYFSNRKERLRKKCINKQNSRRKKAYSDAKADTGNTKEYFHKYYPI